MCLVLCYVMLCFGFWLNFKIKFLFFSHVTVVRGQVLFKNGQPLIGVKVSVVGNSDYGFTLTRDNGM
jgi:hypothetical protein